MDTPYRAKQLTARISPAVQACATPAAVNWPIGTVVVVPAPVCLQANTVVVFVVTSVQVQFQPFCAAGSPRVPLLAAPPLPTLIVKAAVPLLVATDGEVPKPEEIVGAERDSSRFRTAKLPLNVVVPALLYPWMEG